MRHFTGGVSQQRAGLLLGRGMRYGYEKGSENDLRKTNRTRRAGVVCLLASNNHAGQLRLMATIIMSCPELPVSDEQARMVVTPSV